MLQFQLIVLTSLLRKALIPKLNGLKRIRNDRKQDKFFLSKYRFKLFKDSKCFSAVIGRKHCRREVQLETQDEGKSQRKQKLIEKAFSDGRHRE